MTTDEPHDQACRPVAFPPGPLQELTPHQIAEMIRGLDSRLAGIEYDTNTSEPVLVYRFKLAGRCEGFAVAAGAGPLLSIADLYPEAEAFERALTQHYGVQFQNLSPDTASCSPAKDAR